MTDIIASYTFPDTHEITMTTKKKYINKLRFRSVGNKQPYSTNPSELNAIEVITTFSSNEQFFLAFLNEYVETNNKLKVDFNSHNYSSNTIYKLKKGLTGLYKRDVVRKIKRGLYLVNPYFFVNLSNGEFPLSYWEELPQHKNLIPEYGLRDSNIREYLQE